MTYDLQIYIVVQPWYMHKKKVKSEKKIKNYLSFYLVMWTMKFREEKFQITHIFSSPDSFSAEFPDSQNKEGKYFLK